MLGSTLEEHLPLDAAGASVRLAIEPGTSPLGLVEGMGVPKHRVHVVLVNGRFVAPEARATLALRDGDVVEVWPLLAGG